MKNQLPPPTPPYTGGEPNARKHRDAILSHSKGKNLTRGIYFNVTMKRLLPLPKGELEGVQSKI